MNRIIRSFGFIFLGAAGACALHSSWNWAAALMVWGFALLYSDYLWRQSGPEVDK